MTAICLTVPWELLEMLMPKHEPKNNTALSQKFSKSAKIHHIATQPVEDW